MVTALLPVVESQAKGAAIFGRCQADEYQVSLGTRAGGRIRSGSAKATSRCCPNARAAATGLALGGS